MEQLRIHSEILMIVSLGMLINDLNSEKTLRISVTSQSVNLTCFDCHDKIEFQRDVYAWSRQKPFLPKLRALRHELEQIRDAEFAQKAAEVSA